MSSYTYVDTDTNRKINITHQPIDGNNELQWPDQGGEIATLDDLANGVSAKASFIKKPIILSPVEGSTNFNGELVLSNYEPLKNYLGVLTKIVIELSTNEDFSNIISTQEARELSTNINVSIPVGNTTIYIRVMYISNINKSDWSDIISVTTKNEGVNKPYILLPLNNGVDLGLNPLITTSNFSYYGNNDTHKNTIYQISKFIDFSVIVYEFNTTTDLTSHIVNESLVENTDYYIRVKHIGNSLLESDWSVAVKIKTVIVEDFISVFNTTKESTIYISIIVDENTFIHVGYDRVINSGQAKPFIIKTDKNNKILKSKKILANYTIVGDGVFQYVTYYNNKIYAAGYYSTSSGNFLVLYVFDMELNILNAKVFPATVNIQTYCRKIIFNGEYLYLFGTKDQVGFVSKLKISDLSLIKSVKIYDTLATENIATFIQDAIFWNNNFYLSGESYSNGNNGNIMILKLDTDLNIISKKLLTPSPTSYFERIQSLDKDSNNNFYFVGYISNGVNNFKPYILKTDSNFNILISKEFNGTIPGRGLFESIKIDSNNNIIIGGKLNQNTSTLMDDNFTNTMDGFILKMDTNLNIKESLFLGQDNFGENLLSINIKENNLIYFSGATGGKQSTNTNGNAMFGMLNLKGDYLSTAGINTNIKIKDLSFNTGQTVSLSELNNNIVTSTLSLTLGNLVYTEEDLTFLISVKKDIY